MDMLPVQASAVPCKRVFSSSKETDTNRRSNLSSDRMEQLQMLKFSYRNDRLTFTKGLLANEEDHSVSALDAPPEFVDGLYRKGRLTELEDVVVTSWESFMAN